MAPNWKNQTIWTGDNLEIMRGMNSKVVGVSSDFRAEVPR